MYISGPKSKRNYEKIILGTLDTWSTSHLSHRPSEPAYYIVDCRISTLYFCAIQIKITFISPFKSIFQLNFPLIRKARSTTEFGQTNPRLN